jgi:hypothetical protein
MNRSKTFLILLVVALFLVASVTINAQGQAPAAGQKGPTEPGQEPPFSKPYPIGQVTITLKAVGAGVGMQWGSGVLTYEGKQYAFKVRGIQVGTLGISKATAKGDVYNLFGISEFPGHYVAAGMGLAIFKGKEGQAFKNTKGVHIFLKAEEKGVELKIGPEGFTVRLEKVLYPGGAWL